MIIIDKIIEKYSKEEIYKLLPRITARNIIFNRKTLIKAGVLAKYISFDEIGYTLDDYISDYKADKKYKEVKYVFEILRSGKNIGQLAKENDMTDQLDYILKHGFDFNSNGLNLYKVIDIFKIKVDIKKMELEKFENHIELYGEEKELINFREKFKITHPVLYEPIKKKFHLAFDGMLADYLKLYSKS
ncbi:MAG: hypothetical protein SOR11_04740 [Fusobacterium sp.]|uniref:hypothetical protein n=1 Tax=Fusobacterium sp. TaxID=68766 RepID=UPI002A7494B1|nr:hypothetical protein [Fusobacterium sp.]MDY3059290.1 hypothetical protein [Fusobacterium sp.]